MNETLQTIAKRRSIRKFKPEQIPEEFIDRILDAAMLAPSAHNEQSWFFSVIQNPELIQKLNFESKNAAKNFHVEDIRKIAEHPTLDIFYGAPTVIIISGNTKALLNEINCAAATQNLLIAAESLNIGSCWNGIAGILFFKEPEKYAQLFNLPPNYTPLYAVALGYKDMQPINPPLPKNVMVNYFK